MVSSGDSSPGDVQLSQSSGVPPVPPPPPPMTYIIRSSMTHNVCVCHYHLLVFLLERNQCIQVRYCYGEYSKPLIIVLSKNSISWLLIARMFDNCVFLHTCCNSAHSSRLSSERRSSNSDTRFCNHKRISLGAKCLDTILALRSSFIIQ